MKQLIFLCTFFILTTAVFAQEAHYTISGKVIDKNSKAPLAGASVFAQNTTFGVATNANGNFSLKIPNGGYVLVVTFTGYETESMRISNSNANEDLVVELKPREKSMEEVSVVSSNEVK